jgi:tRNA A37 threonylcarbamoyladenosine biosynthesis protein TsaE
LDLYRLEDPRELPELGLEDALTGDAIVLIEWPERAPGLIPPGARWVEIDGAGDGPRTVRIG